MAHLKSFHGCRMKVFSPLLPPFSPVCSGRISVRAFSTLIFFRGGILRRTAAACLHVPRSSIIHVPYVYSKHPHFIRIKKQNCWLFYDENVRYFTETDIFGKGAS